MYNINTDRPGIEPRSQVSRDSRLTTAPYIRSKRFMLNLYVSVNQL